MRQEDMKLLVQRLGEDTFGVVVALALRLAGATLDDIARLVEAGWLNRPVRGVYVPKDVPLTVPVTLHIALAHAGAGSVVTGLTAARLLQLRWVPASSEVLMLVPKDRRRRGTESFVRVRRCVWFDELKTITMYGVAVAPIPVLVVDGGRELRTLQDVRGLVLGAVADQRCSVEELRAILERSASAGTALVRRACVDAERGAASPPEAELADEMVGKGIPFYVNCEIWLNGVLLGVADVWLVGRGVGGELDSREWHGTEDALDATLRRHGRFEAAGLSLEHATPTTYRKDPAGFVARMVAEADRRDALGLREPAGLVLKPRGPLLR